MPTETPTPRRKRHFGRWLIVFIVATLAWSGWRAYAFRSALAEAKALGWTVDYTEPVETIRADWKAAFNKETWLDGVTNVDISASEAFEQHLAILNRLNPKALWISDAATMRDLSLLKPLTRLEEVGLPDCTGLKNVDELKNIPSLTYVSLEGCTGLTNVDAMKNLTALQKVDLRGCTALSKQNVEALKAALPNTDIFSPATNP